MLGFYGALRALDKARCLDLDTDILGLTRVSKTSDDVLHVLKLLSG